MADRTLNDDEIATLQAILTKGVPVSILIHGEGEFRDVSFYGIGTRLEARINVPETDEVR